MTSAPHASSTLDVRRRASHALDGATPTQILHWAHQQFGDDLVVTASFGDAVLVHAASSAISGIEIALIDTGYLFAETLWYAETLRSLLDLNLVVVRPRTVPEDDDRWLHDTGGCCGVRKVEPLNRVLHGRSGWISGVRRDDGPLRAGTPVAAFDGQRRLTKINPIVAMTDADCDEYHAIHGLPRHPLTDRGYPSIGCWPCTRPVEAGGDARSGRWAGSEKTECGLHR